MDLDAVHEITVFLVVETVSGVWSEGWPDQPASPTSLIKMSRQTPQVMESGK